jgi:hypothetical protein
MKIAYFAESSADEAALRIITEAILGRQTEPVLHAGLRHRGWPAVKTVLRSVLLELHYRTDAEGFVFIVDSNGTPSHLLEHEKEPDARCRLCQLRRIIDDAQRQARPRTHLPPLKIAVGLAVPAIEAWLLCGSDPHVTEAAWINGLKLGQLPYTKDSLKDKLYGTSHPSLPIETEAMTVAASRLAENFSNLTNLFPGGFGALQASLKGW